MTLRNKLYRSLTGCVLLLASACVPAVVPKKERTATPEQFAGNSPDTVNSAKVNWREFFTDPNLSALIDMALYNNQEYNIVMQEIEIARNEVRARKGEYLPFLSIGAGAGVDKVGTYTRAGAVEENNDIAPGRPFPDPLADIIVSANITWEADVWRKLRNAKKAAAHRYLASIDGKNFMATHLIAEIASTYYELMALDNQLEILRRNIEIQQNALEIVRMEKQAAKVTELAVRRFEAEVLKNRSRQFDIAQRITETENRINFLVGRFPQPVQRSGQDFATLIPPVIHEGIPSQLLLNRPDIRQAEQQLAASKLDVKSARANFYPNIRITAGAGYNAFNTSFFFKTPASLIYSAAGELLAPVINRNAIKAYYYSANARQVQQVYDYERSILNAYVEVANQMSNVHNLEQSYALREQQVQALTESISISTRLFKSARADYMEVLLTQRDALESRFDLVETRMQQMNAVINIYQALGGGWQ
ncbi:MAG TPA: TolC family protein [Chryseolinea sp.]|nr:TolC family protein [Chryseolinea sp.]